MSMQPSSLLSEFEHIDTIIGLKYLNNNYELYIKILNNFLLRYGDLDFDRLSSAEEQDVIHSIKGLSATLGMSTLAKLSKELNIGNRLYFSEFKLELTKVLNELDRVFNMESRLKSILILNDNEVDIDNFVDVLEDNYDILVALEIHEAREILDTEHIDLIILSLDLLDIEGLIDLRETIKMKEIPMILTTERENLKKDDIDIVVKSFNSMELIDKIERIL